MYRNARKRGNVSLKMNVITTRDIYKIACSEIVIKVYVKLFLI